MRNRKPAMSKQPVRSESVSTPFRLRRLWPLILLACGLLLVFAFDLDRFLSLSTLQQEHLRLEVFVVAHYFDAVLIYMAVYALVVALSLPGGAVMTLAGGYLFGAPWGTAYVVVAATIGATGLFLAAKSAIGDWLLGRAGPWTQRLEHGFRANAWSYLLILRLIPAVPFFVVNLLPAFLGVSLRCYVVTTFLGIIPGTAVYAALGAGLGDLIAADAPLSLKTALQPTILFGLIGLAALSALPIFWKIYKERR